MRPGEERERRVGGTWKRLFWFISSLPSAPLSLRYRFHVPLRALLLSSVVGTERRPARRASRDEWNEERERREERDDRTIGPFLVSFSLHSSPSLPPPLRFGSGTGMEGTEDQQNRTEEAG